jgi:SPP1 gp7 family putative phage head morphogenesis protein
LSIRDWFRFRVAPAEFKASERPYSGEQRTANPASVDTSVISIERAQFGAGESYPRVNLDDLAARKTLAVYAKMRLDEQVKAAVTFKRDAILSRGWTFEFDEDSRLPDAEKAQRIKVSQKTVKKMPGSFIDALNVVSTGREFGFSVTEKVYAPIECDGKQYVGLGGLLGRDPKTFNFFTDEHGTLVRCEQEAGARRIPIDLAKFVHYVHNPEFDRYFGRSDLREAYRSWYFKDTMIRYWGLYMEKLGGGLVVAKLGEASNIQYPSSQYDELTAALAQVKATASVLLPKGVEAEVVFPQNSDAFEKACTWHDLAIAKALLVPNLAGVSHTGQTGAYSQAQSQLEAFAWTLKADAERLESCVDEQLFRDLGEQNWGDGEYPCFKFKPLSGEQLRWIVDTFLKLVTGGAVLATEVDEARLREILEMPPRDASTPLLVDPNEEAQREHELAVAEKTAKAEPGELPRPKDGETADEFRRLVRFGFDPNQPRDADGQWDETGAGSALEIKPGPSISSAAAKKMDIADASKHLERRGLKLKPLQPRASDGFKPRYEVTDKNGRSKEVSVKDIQDLLTGKKNTFGFDPSQPRDADGKWGSGGGSNGLSERDQRIKGKVESIIAAGERAMEAHEKNPGGGRAGVKRAQIAKAIDAAHSAMEALEDLANARKTGASEKEVQQLSEAANGAYVNASELASRANFSSARHALTPQQARIAIASSRERVDFAIIDRRQSMLERELSMELAATVARAVNKELGAEADLARLIDSDTDDIGQWQLPAAAVGRLKVASQKALAESWAMGAEHARAEVRKTRKVVNIRFADLRGKAASYFESNAFKMAGDVSDRARSIVQQELLTSVKVGRSPKQTRTAIWERLVAKGLSSPEAVRLVETDAAVNAALDELWKDSVEEAASYLDTVARTNLFTAMNEARFTEFSDPALSDFVVALRYSAVLDQHTTDICQGLHELVYRTDNELWNVYRPPNHFNCRSVLVPVTVIDVEDGLWDGQESEPPSVEPQEGFGI